MGIAFVTGTSTGIGQATAIALARAGHVVYAGQRDLAAAAPLEAVAARENVRIEPVRLDVDDDASVAEAFRVVLDAEGRVDVLVNNAGVGGGAAVEETSLDVFRAVMETNFFGVVRCTKAVLPGMRERRSGCIVNVASVAGRLAMSPQASYAASKFAVEAMSECLAQEMAAYGVRVALIEPGVIATPIFSKFERQTQTAYPIWGRRLLSFFEESLKQPSPPELVASTIVDFVTGTRHGLRHPVGPDAQFLLKWRQEMSDEDFIGLTDAQFVAAAKHLGLDLPL
jgi:NAD(P)-dependent dehydrogenase (short-subunit alcohol dehydrogenase family)